PLSAAAPPSHLSTLSLHDALPISRVCGRRWQNPVGFRHRKKLLHGERCRSQGRIARRRRPGRRWGNAVCKFRLSSQRRNAGKRVAGVRTRRVKAALARHHFTARYLRHPFFQEAPAAKIILAEGALTLIVLLALLSRKPQDVYSTTTRN